jgi:hypothetical protein
MEKKKKKQLLTEDNLINLAFLVGPLTTWIHINALLPLPLPPVLHFTPYLPGHQEFSLPIYLLS